MKLYNYEPPYLIRLQIIKQGEQTEYITLAETTMEEAQNFCKTIIEKQNLSPFQTGKVTAINIREGMGAKNGLSRTISFKGLSPKETHDLIINNLEK